MSDQLYQSENFGIAWLNIKLPFSSEIHFLRPRYDPNDFHKNDKFKILLRDFWYTPRL